MHRRDEKNESGELVDALRELTRDGPWSQQAHQLADLLESRQLPTSIDSALAIRGPAAIDISSIQDAVPFPIAIPPTMQHLLPRVPEPRQNSGRVERWICDARERHGAKQRAALLALANCAASEAIDSALEAVVSSVRDPYAVGLAACGLAAHARLSAADALSMLGNSLNNDTDEESLLLMLLACSAAVSTCGSHEEARELVLQIDSQMAVGGDEALADMRRQVLEIHPSATD